MLNRCKNTGLERKELYLNPIQSMELRQQIDLIIDQQIKEWEKNTPGTDQHKRKKDFNMKFYQRALAETAIRIRLLRVVESKAIGDMAKISPDAAQKWAEYEADEMLHDEMFLQDLIASGVSKNEFLQIEPSLSTKLLVGFFSYILDHEGPLGVVAYSYLVEYVNVKLESKKLESLKDILGQEMIQGQLTHANTDIGHDHPGMVWNCLRYLIFNEQDIENLKKYLKEFQKILVLFFEEMNEEFNVSLLKNEQIA